MRWGALAADLALLGTPLFEAVDMSDRAAPAAAGDLVAELAGLEPAAASARVVELLRAEAATILRLPPEAVSPTRPLTELGFDSLMAVELKLSAEEKFGVALPALALSDGATLSALAAKAAADLRGGGAAASDASSALVARHAGGTLSQAIQARLEDAEPTS
jgi:acyl carrier protein